MSEKEGGKENFEFIRLATNYLSDRFLQPLSAALLISWGAWNYKILMILISFDTIKTKFENIEAIHSRVVFKIFGYSIESFWWNGCILPAVSALAFIYVYPYAAHHALGYTLVRQRHANNLKRINSEEELIDVARGRELVKENSQLKIANEKIKIDAAEREKNLIETINILESENFRLREQVASLQKSHADGFFAEDMQGGEDDISASSINDEPRSDSDSDSESEKESSYGQANADKIRNSQYIWRKLSNSIYSLDPNVEFQVPELFEQDVWSAYNGAQRNVILDVFKEHFHNGEFINLRLKVAADKGDLDTYISVPFAEYLGSKEIQDRALAFLNSKIGTKLVIGDIHQALGIRVEIIENCLNYLVERDFVKAHSIRGGTEAVYTLSAKGRLYAEALDH